MNFFAETNNYAGATHIAGFSENWVPPIIYLKNLTFRTVYGILKKMAIV